MSNPTQDSGIPVLTEVLATPEPSVASMPDALAAALEIEAAIPAFLRASQATMQGAPAALKEIEGPAEATENASNNQLSADQLADIPLLQIEIESPRATIEHAPTANWMDEEWTRIEKKITERVLTQLMGRLETDLEERMQAMLTTSLQRATAEIKQGLQQTLGAAISDAVALEIRNIQFLKK